MAEAVRKTSALLENIAAIRITRRASMPARRRWNCGTARLRRTRDLHVMDRLRASWVIPTRSLRSRCWRLRHMRCFPHQKNRIPPHQSAMRLPSAISGDSDSVGAIVGMFWARGMARAFCRRNGWMCWLSGQISRNGRRLRQSHIARRAAAVRSKKNPISGFKPRLCDFFLFIRLYAASGTSSTTATTTLSLATAA